MKKLLWTVSAVALLGVSACTVKPLVRPGTAYFPTTRPTIVAKTVNQVAQESGFNVVDQKPGVIEVVYPTDKRANQFQARFAVHYTTKSVQVKYLDSRGLDESDCYQSSRGVCVHRNVGRWMGNLQKRIKDRLNTL